MSGPVWRREENLEGVCDECLLPGTTFFVEGAITDNALVVGRRVCPTCYARRQSLEIGGELGEPSVSPAYVGHR